jgi:hypothetical protein
METLGHLTADPSFLSFARFAATSFFAIVFLQSSLSKIADVDGTRPTGDVFKDAPTLSGMVEPRALYLDRLFAGVPAASASSPSASSPGFACRGITFVTFCTARAHVRRAHGEGLRVSRHARGLLRVAMLGLLRSRWATEYRPRGQDRVQLRRDLWAPENARVVPSKPVTRAAWS